ncbi:hypothetical protein BGZ74_005847 [Mortierella antarctica]|nr:hypothetical protein BGZ74_005847 [Mortierella antarctica]
MSFPSLLSDHEQKAFSQFVTQLAKEENARNQQFRSQQYSSEWSSPSQQHSYQQGHVQPQHQHHQQTQVLPSQNGPVPSAGVPSMTLPLPTDTQSLQLALAQHQRDWITQISANPLLAPGGTIDPHAMSQAILQNPELMAQANAITQAMVLAQQQQQQQMMQQRQYNQGSGRDSYEPYHQQHAHHQHHHQQQPYPPMKQEPLSPRSAYPPGSYNHHDRSRSITPPSVPSQNGYHSSSTSPKGQLDLGYGYPQLPPPVPNYHGDEYDLMPKKSARKGSSSSSLSNESPLSPALIKHHSRDQYYHQYDERLEDALTKEEFHGQVPGVTSTSKTGKKQELLTDAEKKANHIASEQKRRQNIRIGFDSLVDIVPSLSDCHRSEALILQKSVDYIQRLLHQKNQLKSKVRDLQNNLGESIDDEDSGTEMDI